MFLILIGIVLLTEVNCHNCGCDSGSSEEKAVVGANEEQNECGNVCEINCMNYGNLTRGSYNPKDCRKGFYCIKGYFRDSNGICSPMSDFPGRKYNIIKYNILLGFNK
jgi:hypothetical protein